MQLRKSDTLKMEHIWTKTYLF